MSPKDKVFKGNTAHAGIIIYLNHLIGGFAAVTLFTL